MKICWHLHQCLNAFCLASKFFSLKDLMCVSMSFFWRNSWWQMQNNNSIKKLFSGAMADLKSTFLNVYSVLKSELLHDPAFEFSDDARHWVDRVYNLIFPLLIVVVELWMGEILCHWCRKQTKRRENEDVTCFRRFGLIITTRMCVFSRRAHRSTDVKCKMYQLN